MTMYNHNIIPVTEKIKILVAENEELQLYYLKSLLNKNGYEVLPYYSAEIPFEDLEGNPPDLAILDIDFGEKNKTGGVKLAALLKERFQIPVIFVTGFSSNYQHAKTTKPEIYLSKPHKDDDILRNVDLAIERHYCNNKKYPNADFRRQNTWLREGIDTWRVKVSYSNLRYIESDNINTFVYAECSSKSQYHIKGVSLKNWEMNLPKTRFCRVHKGYIINLGKISRIDNNHVWIGDTPIPIGDRYRGGLFDKLENEM